MTYRGQGPCDSISYYESPQQTRRNIGLLSNKYRPSAKVGHASMYQLQNYHGYPCKFDYHVNYNCFNEPFAVSLYNTYTQTCMAQSLRQAYDYWQDQPDYYPHALLLNGVALERLPKEKQYKVVRFGKELYDPLGNIRQQSISVA